MLKYCCVLFSFLMADLLSACELVMGYRTNAKQPFISAAPDNSGLYFDLYDEASRRIDCRLKIVRQPKGRIMHLIKLGEIDFYPGLSFSKERSEYVAFLPNGLKDGYIGLTREYEAEIRSLHDVAQRKLTMVVSFGSHDLSATSYGIRVRKPYDFDLEQIVDLILEQKADFHAYNLLTVMYFLRKNPEKASQLKVHENCCEEPKQMFFAFSKRSINIQMIDNMAFKKDLPLAQNNTPDAVSSESLAWKLHQALRDMKKDGSYQKIYSAYFDRL